MPNKLHRIGRIAIHMPRRFLYAFLWAARPPEDRDNDVSSMTSAEGTLVPAAVTTTTPRAR